MRYTVVLEQETDGGYVASVPALPGYVSQGNDRAEAMANIREAIVVYVEDCKDAGDPIATESDADRTARQLESLKGLGRKLDAMPVAEATDGLSNRDHDRILYEQ
jgi:predicted RNase H-like HicB family nuclease